MLMEPIYGFVSVLNVREVDHKFFVLRKYLEANYSNIKKSNGELWLYNECTERWKQSLYV